MTKDPRDGIGTVFLMLLSVLCFQVKGWAQTDPPTGWSLSPKISTKGSMIANKTLTHPVIYTTPEERGHILDLVENYQWAQSVMNQLHSRVDATKDTHQSNPASILNTIPAFGDNLSGHSRVLRLAAESGMLYFLTEEEGYGQLSADILAAYIDVLAPLSPQTTTISGDAFQDPRTSYNYFALAYDFVHSFLTDSGTRVYNLSADSLVAFDNDKAQQALTNIVGNILQEYGKADVHGRVVSNHPILTAPGALFSILCIEDPDERDRLFEVFWETGTWHQASFKHTILPMFSGQGIWPEPVSYSFMPNIPLILNLVDRIYPEMAVTRGTLHIFKGSFLFENLRLPDRRFVRYGDSKREKDATPFNLRYTLDIAERNGYNSLKQKVQVALKQAYQAGGGYHPELTDYPYDNYNHLELFWGIPLPEGEVEEFDYKPTVIVDHAGVAVQRNHVEKNNVSYGLCGYIGGAHYVHSHLTGIAMELYGSGYVMAPNAGLPPSTAERKIPLHEHYFRLYAGNNTIIVNGSSHGLQPGSWKGNAYVWQNTTENIAAEPEHLEDPICEDFSFATQFLADKVNNCHQERTLSIIRTSPTTGYYFDVFRSKSLNANNFHDYIYHNLGDETRLLNARGEAMELTPTDRYDNDIGDPVFSPGWRFFENEQVTAPDSGAVKVRFDLNADGRYMHMLIPGGVEREYTHALAPPTREAKNGYVHKKTQVMAIRQQGEAWDKPYVAVFEPSHYPESSVQRVDQLEYGNRVVGAVVQSRVGQVLVTDYIISNDNEDGSVILAEENISFEGRFGIVRKEEMPDSIRISLYIGQGSSLSYGEHALVADGKMQGFKVFEFDSSYVSNAAPHAMEVELFPNPCKDWLSIQLNENLTAGYSLYNSSGVQVMSGRFNTQTTLSLEEHLKGIYLLELASVKKRTMHKIFIE